MVPFVMRMKLYISFYLVVQSGAGALGSHLFMSLQGQLDVARPLRLLLGINLQAQGSEVSERGEKGQANYFELVP